VGVQWGVPPTPFGQKEFFSVGAAFLPHNHAVARNEITSACFIATGAKLTRCA
jgi:hypothetical protein